MDHTWRLGLPPIIQKVKKVSSFGSVVQGSVLDMNKKYFCEKLKQYDPRLYLKWNPKKRKGHGVWEIRIKPSKPTLVYHGEFMGQELCSLEYIESDMIHHVLDVNVLNMQVFNKLREMDAWENKNLIAEGDYEAERQLIKQELQQDEERLRMIRENKKYFRELHEVARSGVNPASLFFGRYGK